LYDSNLSNKAVTALRSHWLQEMSNKGSQNIWPEPTSILKHFENKGGRYLQIIQWPKHVLAKQANRSTADE
jgi:hypothetical protein